MDLTQEQVEAAAACGCAFVPASEAQVARLSMQRRVFRIDGKPFMATRDGGGFFETHGTLSRLIEGHGRGGRRTSRKPCRRRGGRCGVRKGDRGGAPRRGRAGGPAPPGRSAPDTRRG